jgi:hypothetical protein
MQKLEAVLSTFRKSASVKARLNPAHGQFVRPETSMHLNNPKSSEAQGREHRAAVNQSYIYHRNQSESITEAAKFLSDPLRSRSSSKAPQICRYPHPFDAGR